MKLIKKNLLYNEHFPSILVTFLGETEHFSGKNGALRWSILVGKQKHNVQKPRNEAAACVGPRTYRPIECVFISSNQSALRSRLLHVRCA